MCVCVGSANSIPGDSLCLQVEFSLRGSGSGYEFKPTVKVFQVLHPKRWIPFAVFLPETRKVHCNTTPTRASVWITSRIGCWTLMSNAYPFSPSRLILLQAQLSNPRAPILLIRKAFNFQIAARPPKSYHTLHPTARNPAIPQTLKTPKFSYIPKPDFPCTRKRQPPTIPRLLPCPPGVGPLPCPKVWPFSGVLLARSRVGDFQCRCESH